MEYKIVRSSDYLEHHGVKGQKHGVRRFQNTDGSLTAEGRDHYGVGDGRQTSGVVPQKNQSFIARHKKGLAIAGGVLAAGLAAYGVSRLINNKSVQKGSEATKNILAERPHTLNAPRVETPRIGISRTNTPKVDTRRLQRNSKKFQREAARNMARNQRMMDQLDRMQEDILRNYGYKR